MQTITSIPGSDFWVEGITNLRGRVVPVIDLRKRCGVNAGEYTAETRIVVVNGGPGMVGFIVDAVSEVMRIPGEQVEPPPLPSIRGFQVLQQIDALGTTLQTWPDREIVEAGSAELTITTAIVSRESDDLDDEAKQHIYRGFSNALRPGGLLFIGGSEMIMRSADLGFRTAGTSMYPLAA